MTSHTQETAEEITNAKILISCSPIELIISSEMRLVNASSAGNDGKHTQKERRANNCTWSSHPTCCLTSFCSGGTTLSLHCYETHKCNRIQKPTSLFIWLKKEEDLVICGKGGFNIIDTHPRLTHLFVYTHIYNVIFRYLLIQNKNEFSHVCVA